MLANIEEQSRHAQVLYKGFLGDALLGFGLKRRMWADYERDTRHRVHEGVHRDQGLLNYDDPEQRRLFTDTFLARVGNAAFQAYADAMDRSGSRQLANQRVDDGLTQRVPRMTLTVSRVARGRAIVRSPFRTTTWSILRSQRPAGIPLERYSPKVAFVKCFPRLAEIPIAGTGRPLVSCARDVAAQVRGLLSWHLRHRGLGYLAGRERRPVQRLRRLVPVGVAALGRGYPAAASHAGPRIRQARVRKQAAVPRTWPGPTTRSGSERF